MNDNRAHARAWLAKAENDLVAARRLLAADGPFDAVCFHAQQACEKALKAVLALADQEIPRTHNLAALQARCIALLQETAAAALGSLDIAVLTPYAIEARYDAEFQPDRQAAADACAVAEQVMSLIPPLLVEP